MKRRTLICLFKDDSKKEFCIRNRNIDFFGTQFRRYLDAIPQDDGDYSLIQETMIINKFFANSSFEIISIIEAENRYNRDQSSINKFKDEYSRRLTVDGYTWNEELDKFFKERYNDNEENNKLRDTLMNFRNIQTLYEEKGSMLSKELNKLIKELDSLREQIKEGKNQIKELVEKRDVLSSDVESLRDTFKRGKEYIKEQKENIEQLEKTYSKKLEELTITYNSKKDEYDSNYQKYVDERNSSLSEDIRDKEERIQFLEKRIDGLETELDLRLDEFNKGLDNERDKFKESMKTLEADRNRLTEEIKLLESRKSDIQETIEKRISNLLTKEILIEKLDTLINTVKKNENYYHNTIPSFEIEYLNRLGLDKEMIFSKVKENNMSIKFYD